MTTRKTLPLGIQSFPELIEKNYLYIDKTAYIYKMVSEGKLYFLSRPRRFGKSVLVSTLEALFRGRRELFDGLFISGEHCWDWQPRPVIRLDFLGLRNNTLEAMEEDLNDRLDEQAEKYGIRLQAPSSNRRFRELILGLFHQGRVAVLIDEYDKPILDQITNPEQAEANRQFLATFYAVLKSLEEKLDFLLMTGVSKFTQVSLFSELNNLQDITLHPAYAGIAGYTEEEVARYFEPYLNTEIEGFSGNDLRDRIKKWYNGYSWDGETRIYNPVSLLELLYRRRFSPFWFATGTPRFLLELLRSEMVFIPQLDRTEIGDLAMHGFEPRDVHPIALLFQTGYLTIKHIERTDVGSIYHMGFPNLEVRRSFLAHFLAQYAGNQPDNASLMASRLGNYLKEGDIDAFFEGFRRIFASIPYNIFLADREAYYHTIVYLVLSLMGVHLACEIQTNIGRIDAVLETDEAFYVTEFKMGSAMDAVDQIRARDYAAAYRGLDKKVLLLGVGIDSEDRSIKDWLCLPDSTAGKNS